MNQKKYGHDFYRRFGFALTVLLILITKARGLKTDLRNNVSIKSSLLLLPSPIFKYKLEKYYLDLRKGFNDNTKDVLNELLLKTDTTIV